MQDMWDKKMRNDRLALPARRQLHLLVADRNSCQQSRLSTVPPPILSFSETTKKGQVSAGSSASNINCFT